MTVSLMLMACADLNPGCEAELCGGSPDDIVLQYARHASSCMHTARQVDLDELLAAVTVASLPRRRSAAAVPTPSGSPT